MSRLTRRVMQMVKTAAAPSGFQQFTSSGSFVVPVGVTAINVAAVAPGGIGEPGVGANSGGAAYRNAIPVTPGETLSIGMSGNQAIEAGSAYLTRSGTFLAGTTRDNPYIGGQTHFQGGYGNFADTLKGASTPTFNPADPAVDANDTSSDGPGQGFNPGNNTRVNGFGAGSGTGGYGHQGGVILIRWGSGSQFPGPNP